jgi:hypothetical protein
MDVGPSVDECHIGVHEGVKTGARVGPGGCDPGDRVCRGALQSSACYSREEATLVTEVDIWRLVAHTDPMCHLADTESLSWLDLEQFQRSGDEPIRQLRPTGRHFHGID